MKKIICMALTAVFLITPATAAFAQQGGQGEDSQCVKQQYTQQNKYIKYRQSVPSRNVKEKKQSFKLNGCSVIRYGRYKLPIAPITKGMGAAVNFDQAKAVLTVTKGPTTIVIDFKNSTVTVNGVADTKSGIFTASNSRKMTVLIKYIAKALGIRVSVGGDDVDVTVPGLDSPTNVTVTPVGGTVIANTLNSTNLFLAAAANIVAGQAVGGRAELYVGSRLVATDAVITATDTTVNFTTADASPVNAELQAAIPAGGSVTVKLYNAGNSFVTSTAANPVLTVDYSAPSVTGITSAVYSISGGTLTVKFTGAGLAGDRVDVTKISLYDTALAKVYQLTNLTGTGSAGTVFDNNTLVIRLGSIDAQGLTGFGGSAVYLSIAAASFLTDAAGNTSAGTVITVPVTVTN